MKKLFTTEKQCNKNIKNKSIETAIRRFQLMLINEPINANYLKLFILTILMVIIN